MQATEAAAALIAGNSSRRSPIGGREPHDRNGGEDGSARGGRRGPGALSSRRVIVSRNEAATGSAYGFSKHELAREKAKSGKHKGQKAAGGLREKPEERGRAGPDSGAAGAADAQRGGGTGPSEGEEVKEGDKETEEHRHKHRRHKDRAKGDGEGLDGDGDGGDDGHKHHHHHHHHHHKHHRKPKREDHREPEEGTGVRAKSGEGHKHRHRSRPRPAPEAAPAVPIPNTLAEFAKSATAVRAALRLQAMFRGHKVRREFNMAELWRMEVEEKRRVEAMAAEEEALRRREEAELLGDAAHEHIPGESSSDEEEGGNVGFFEALMRRGSSQAAEFGGAAGGSAGAGAAPLSVDTEAPAASSAAASAGAGAVSLGSPSPTACSASLATTPGEQTAGGLTSPSGVHGGAEGGRDKWKTPLGPDGRPRATGSITRGKSLIPDDKRVLRAIASAHDVQDTDDSKVEVDPDFSRKLEEEMNHAWEQYNQTVAATEVQRRLRGVLARRRSQELFSATRTLQGAVRRIIARKRARLHPDATGYGPSRGRGGGAAGGGRKPRSGRIAPMVEEEEGEDERAEGAAEEEEGAKGAPRARGTGTAPATARATTRAAAAPPPAPAPTSSAGGSAKAR